MKASLAAGCLLIAWVSGPGADEVFIRGLDGGWRTLRADRTNGTLRIRISPADTDAGAALVVVAKPEWMTLEDATPPALGSVSAGEAAVEAADRLEIQAEDRGPRVTALLEDDGNPLRLDSPVMTLNGQAFRAAEVRGGPPGRTAAATFDLSALRPGAYEGFLEAQDLAPAGNTLRTPVRVVINGTRRHADGQTVTICKGGHEYVVGGPGQGKAFIRLGSTGAAAYLSTEVGGRFVYARNVVRQENLPDGHGVRLIADVIGIDEQDFGQIAELEFDLATRPEFPGLLVTSRARNLDADGDVYCFWGWLPGSGYVTRDGEQSWTMEYAEIGSVGWVFLPAREPSKPGIGVISALPFGESRFGTLLIYTDPKRIRTERAGAVEMRLAFMLADDPGSVAEAYGKLVGTGWLAGE